VFVDVAEESGIHFRHDSGKRGDFLFPESNSGGGGFCDLDGDGDPDVILLSGTAVQADGSSASSVHLYENKGSGRFLNITTYSGLVQKGDMQTFAVADADHDGDLDLAVAGYNILRLYINDGKNRFHDATSERGLSNFKGFANALAWIDTERTGWPDLVVGRYGKWSPEINRKLDCRRIDGKLTYCGPVALKPDRMAFYRNDKGHFTDHTKESGMWDSPTKALGLLTFDHDNDGWPDLFVANDTQPNLLFRNQQDGTFSEEGLLLGLVTLVDSQPYSGMGVDVVDFNGDGRLCLAVGNFEGEPVTLHCQSENGEGGWTSDFYEEHTFDVNIFDSTSPLVTFGLKFADLDLDGICEMIVANGHIFDHEDLTGMPQSQVLQVFAISDQTDKGVPVFQDVTPKNGFAGITGIGRGLATADIDHDGDIDILYIDKDGPTRLLRNDSPLRGDPIRFRLIGDKGAPEGLGAKLSFSAGEHSYSAAVVSGGSYAGESERILSFGLEHNIRPKNVEVQWPNGAKEHFNIPDKGILLTLKKGHGSSVENPTREGQTGGIVLDKDADKLQDIVRNLFVHKMIQPERIDEIIDRLHNELKLRPGHNQLTLSLARLLAMTGKLKEACTVLNQALDNQPSLMEVRLELLMLLWISGDKENAISQLSYLLRQFSNQSFRLKRFAVPLLDASVPFLALQVIDTVLADDPDHSNAHALRIGALLNLGNFDEAETFGLKSLKKYPDHPQILVSMGFVALQRNSNTQAGNYFRSALKIRKKGEETPEALAGLATVLVKDGRAKEAAALLLEAVDLKPNPIMSFSAAQLLFKLKDISGAKIALERTLQIEPRDIPALISLGSLEMSEGNYLEALQHFREILKYSPNDPLALDNIRLLESKLK
ncbi:MAG: tetratricopeptide repeat protein, partial [Candidatus Scalindua sp.]|nr:tetratricopeptide repeat protein [Candidatus Scalindua sp.]